MNKKVLFILPVLAMLLAGCNKAQDNSPIDSEESTTSQSAAASSETSSEQSTSSQEASSEETSSEETSSEEQSSEEQSSEEQSSEQSSSEEESSSSEESLHAVAISVAGVSTALSENKEAVIDTEHGQITEFTGALTNLVKGQEVVFTFDGAPIEENIGSDYEDELNKNLVQGSVGNFVIHNDAASSNVTFKVYETGYAFWLTGYVADAPVEDSYKLFVKRGSEIDDFDMAQNTTKETEYYRQGLELLADDEVFFCITIDEVETWYHYSNVKDDCIDLVKDSEPYIHGEEEEARSDHNLVIKADGTYDFYVDTALTKGIWVSKHVEPQPEQLKTFYLKPNANWLEKGDGVDPRFAVYAFGGSQGEQWFDMTKVADGVYSVQIDVANFAKIIFCRMNGTTTENNWDNKYNQTKDLAITELETNCYTVEEGTWDSGNGTWSTYTEE